MRFMDLTSLNQTCKSLLREVADRGLRTLPTGDSKALAVAHEVTRLLVSGASADQTIGEALRAVAMGAVSLNDESNRSARGQLPNFHVLIAPARRAQDVDGVATANLLAGPLSMLCEVCSDRRLLDVAEIGQQSYGGAGGAEIQELRRRMAREIRARLSPSGGGRLRGRAQESPLDVDELHGFLIGLVESTDLQASPSRGGHMGLCARALTCVLCRSLWAPC
jgi:hypothetical protein